MAQKKSKKIKKFFYFIVCILTVVSCCLYYFYVIAPIAYDTARAEARNNVADIISEALYTIFLEGVNYEEMVKIDKDYQGNVVMVSALPKKANEINYYLVKRVQEELEEKRNQKIEIPYGTFIGNVFFMGKGKSITFYIDLIGSPQNEFISNFTSAGINQTVHKIFIKSTVNVRIMLPYKTISEEVNVEILLAENLIAGKVPEVYINSLDWGNMLDLVPNY